MWSKIVDFICDHKNTFIAIGLGVACMVPPILAMKYKHEDEEYSVEEKAKMLLMPVLGVVAARSVLADDDLSIITMAVETMKAGLNGSQNVSSIGLIGLGVRIGVLVGIGVYVINGIIAAFTSHDQQSKSFMKDWASSGLLFPIIINIPICAIAYYGIGNYTYIFTRIGYPGAILLTLTMGMSLLGIVLVRTNNIANYRGY